MEAFKAEQKSKGARKKDKSAGLSEVEGVDKEDDGIDRTTNTRGEGKETDGLGGKRTKAGKK